MQWRHWLTTNVTFTTCISMWSGASNLEKRGMSQKGSFWYHFLLRLEIDRWILRCCQSITSTKFYRYTVYRQYLLIKTTTLVFCTGCRKIQLATSSLIKINANSLFCSLQHTALWLHQVVCDIQTTPHSSQ